MLKLLAMTVVVVAMAPAFPAMAQPQVGGDAKAAKPWHIDLPRPAMLTAWERIRKVEIPGIPVDQRFKVEGPAYYYVGPGGDDSADGSKEHPWKTLAHAADRLAPGSVIYLLAGMYYGPVTIRTKATENAPAALRGIDGQEVVITYSEEFIAQEKAKIARTDQEGALDHDGKQMHYPSLIAVTGSYVEVSGLHLVGVRHRLPMNLYSESGISFAGGGGAGCRAIYNQIENTGHCGIKEMGHGGAGILIEGNYIHDIGQTFHDHGLYLPADDATVRKNILVNAAGWGVHAYSQPKRTVISHNIIGGNDYDGVILAGSDARVFNNVFYKNHGGGVFFFRSGAQNNLVTNNLFIEALAFRYDSMGSTAPQAQPRENVVDYNCLAGETRQGAVSVADTIGSHNIKADPMCIDTAGWDFRLRPGSPCLGAGDARVIEKWLGKSPDIGVYGIE